MYCNNIYIIVVKLESECVYIVVVVVVKIMIKTNHFSNETIKFFVLLERLSTHIRPYIRIHAPCTAVFNPIVLYKIIK